MSTLTIGNMTRAAAIATLILACGTACGPASTGATGAPLSGSPAGSANPVVGAPADGLAGGGPAPAGGGSAPSGHPATSKPAGSTSAPSWPSPEDCISYNPSNVTVHYEAGIFQVTDGSKVVMRLHGDPSSDTGQKGLALAQRYQRHCFLGRNNTRADKFAYVFDYWRDPSGKTPTIADQDNDCSPYNRNNLTVEDMGDGNGWRVKDHDHVLQLFDTGDDARNGKTVLVKYGQICFIGDSDDDQDQVSYSL